MFPPLAHCSLVLFSTVVNALAWQCLLGAGSLGVWFGALHEISYFIMMELFFLLPCDFFFEVNLICVCVVLFCPPVSLYHIPCPHLILNKLFTCFLGSMIITGVV